jgi:aryl-alcohol dehydrogenase-like predicted oxidoreductase
MGFDRADYRSLGKSDILVSPLGLGTVKLGRNTNVRYPEGFELPSSTEAQQLLEQAQTLGINLIDTAPAYGSSEERLGQLLEGQRDRWVICTKVGETYRDNKSAWDFSPQATRRSIEQSLLRLRTDRLDIVLVHSDGNDVAIIEESGVIEALIQLRERGDIRAIGVSTKTLDGAMLAIERTDAVMVEFSPSDSSQTPAIDRANELGKGVLVKKALSSGHSSTPAEALRLIASRPGVTSIIVGTISPAHLESNVEALQAEA